MDAPEPPSTRRPPPRRLIWILLVLAAASSGAAAYAWSQDSAEPDMPEAVTLDDLGAADLGALDIAPDFSVPTLDGAGFSLSRHQAEVGKPVLLNLWASWCLPCRAEMPAIDAAAVRYPDVEFVGVAVQDDLVAAEEFAIEIGVQYTIGFDERDEVNALYPTFGLPVSYLIDTNGTILQTLFGEINQNKIDALIATWFGG